MYYVYILKCSDGTLYSGITNDIVGRIEAHNTGKGAKYTRGRRPVSLFYLEESMSKSDALKRESKIKKLGRNKKLELGEHFKVPAKSHNTQF